MTAAQFAPTAPTDPQLRYIAGLCDERGLPFPDAIYSREEASEIIRKILAREYDPADYRGPSTSPTHDDADFDGYYDDDEVPF